MPSKKSPCSIAGCQSLSWIGGLCKRHHAEALRLLGSQHEPDEIDLTTGTITLGTDGSLSISDEQFGTIQPPRMRLPAPQLILWIAQRYADEPSEDLRQRLFEALG